MLIIYHSNRLDVLKTVMECIIEDKRLDDPLESEIVLVQSKGMEKWVQISFAKKFGIATNIQFVSPRSFIWDMFVQILPDIPKQSALNKQNIYWKLMTLLPGMLQHKAFSDLRNYLNNDIDEHKFFRFISRTADLYDQYLIYRPFWLNSWESNLLIEGLPSMQIWQALLWKAIMELTEKLNQPKWHDANLYSRLISTIESSDKSPMSLPSRIFICGISTIPPMHLDVLKALGKYIDIYILNMNPCRYYWGDIDNAQHLDHLTNCQDNWFVEELSTKLIKSKKNNIKIFNNKKETSSNHQVLLNPLLSSWGKIGRDYIYALYAISSSEKGNINAFLEEKTNSLLRNIQMDILNLENQSISSDTATLQYTRSSMKRCLDPNDHSLTIHVCSNLQHEVEVLHHWLINILQNNLDLTPRDIVVMVADIDRYSPLIQGVFNSAPEGCRIPYAISDCRVRLYHSTIQAFVKLLSLCESRFFSEDIITLLSIPEIAARFNIKEADLYYLRKWVNESGIRWGLNDENVKEFNCPSTGQHTWKFGLTRMLLGYAMKSNQGEWKKILPYDESSGLIVELVGNLGSFVTKLTHLHHEFKKTRTLQNWLPFYKQILNDFFLLDGETEAAMTIVEKQWKNIINEGIVSNYNELISFSFLQRELIHRLDQEDISHYFLAGSVNVCSFIPMRSVPFKIICLLGMNEDVYPRRLQSLNFNLMNYQKIRGDRNQHDDDQYLFLETLISAQQALYISYINSSVQQNRTHCFSSVLVQELLDYIGQSYYLAGDEEYYYEESEDRVKAHITFYHKRTILNQTNYQIRESKEKRNNLYKKLPLKRNKEIFENNWVQILNPLHIKKLKFEKLQSFWSHPVRAFFQQRLRIHYSYEEIITPNIEPFSLNKLDRYELNQKLLTTFLEKKNVQTLYRYYRASGKLPYGYFGDIIWEEQYKEMRALAEQISNYCQSKQNMEINLNCHGVQLTGCLHWVQKSGLLRYSPSAMKISKCLQFWLEHLVYNANGFEKESRLFSRKGDVWCFSPISSKIAKDYLSLFIEGYLRGMNEPLLLLPESGGAWIETFYFPKKRSSLTNEILLQKAQEKFLKIYHGDMIKRGEGKDIWYQRLWRTIEPKYFDIFIKEAKRYLLPMFKYKY